MSGSASPPPAADPVKTAAAQTQMNKDTAVAQTGLNSTNQKTPFGDLEYQQIGTWPDGTPRFEAKQTFSPSQQNIYDLDTENALKLGRVGGAQIDRVGDLLSRPVDLSKAPGMPTFTGDTDAIEARINELARKRLDPILETRRNAAENKLANQGITLGSEAWQQAQGQLGRDENDAYDNLLLTGRSQAFNELGSTYGYGMDAHRQGVSDILAERNQPINEIAALTGGTQITSPNYVGTPQTSVAPTDYSGLVMNADNIAQKNYATDVSQKNALMGGLFGLAAAPLGGWARRGFKLGA